MGERYWITGVQLGLLKAGLQEKQPSEQAIKIIEKIIDEQYIGSRQELLKILETLKGITKIKSEFK